MGLYKEVLIKPIDFNILLDNKIIQRTKSILFIIELVSHLLVDLLVDIEESRPILSIQEPDSQ